MHSIASPKYSPGGSMPRMMLLEYEREVLGFYLSEHPAAEIKKTSAEKFNDIIISLQKFVIVNCESCWINYGN